jgi:hypothetical protein
MGFELTIPVFKRVETIHALDHAVTVMIILRPVGLLGRVVSSSQGLYLNTGQHIHIPNIHALCGIRTHDPGFRASEDSTCLRPLSYRDRHSLLLHTQKDNEIYILPLTN